MKPFYEMTEDERRLFSKRQDIEIRQEEINLMNLLKERYPTFSEKNKKLVLEICTILT